MATPKANMLVAKRLFDRMMDMLAEDPDAEVAEMAEALVVGFSFLASRVEDPERFVSQLIEQAPKMVGAAKAVQAREREPALVAPETKR